MMQENGLVPIIEPEITLGPGANPTPFATLRLPCSHTLARCVPSTCSWVLLRPWARTYTG